MDYRFRIVTIYYHIRIVIFVWGNLFMAKNKFMKTSLVQNKKKIMQLIIISAIAVVGIVVVVCNVLVTGNASGKVFDRVEEIPHRKVGLLLGTAPVTPWGTKNLYFTYRIDAAAKLFHAKKVDFLIVSGDNHSTDYDEPTCMRDSLVACGVPNERIISDYAGFRTLDSVVRCKAIFGQDSVTIISQPFHNERAIYLAGHNQIDAIAFNAQDVTSVWTTWLKIHSRELLARVKMFIDLMVGKQPRFLGEKVEIPEIR